MKTSIILSILILAIALIFGWKQRGHLHAARETHRQAIAEIRALGLSPEELLAGGKSPLATKLARQDLADKTAVATSFAKELIGFAVEMKAFEKEGKQPDEAMQKRIMEIMVRFLDLSPGQIKVVIAELRATGDIDDTTRQGIVGFAVMMLASDHPEAALALFTESADLMAEQSMGGHVISSALGKWAEKDPLGALDWIRKNTEKHSDLVTEDAKTAVIAGAAKQDVKLALGLIGELKLEDEGKIASRLVGWAGTAEERNSLLAALREGGAKQEKLLHAVLGSLGSQVANQGFEEGQAWISTAKLSEEEMAEFARNVSPWQTKDDTGKWIDWMADKLPPKQFSEKRDQMVSQWTREDYKAAGSWINGSPEGPAKQAAVKSYARTVAPYEPASAAQWAATLPTGNERAELFTTIHAEWKKKDPGAAAAFAEEHGLAE